MTRLPTPRSLAATMLATASLSLSACGGTAAEEALRQLGAALSVAVTDLSLQDRTAFEGVPGGGLATAPGVAADGWCAQLTEPGKAVKILELCSDGDVSLGQLPGDVPCADVHLDFGADGVRDGATEACVGENDSGLSVTSGVEFVAVSGGGAAGQSAPMLTLEPRQANHYDVVTIRWRGEFTSQSSLKFRLWQMRDRGFIFWESTELAVVGRTSGELLLEVDPTWPATNSKTGSAYALIPVVDGIEYAGSPLIVRGEAEAPRAPTAPTMTLDDGAAVAYDNWVTVTLGAYDAAWFRIGLSEEELASQPWQRYVTSTVIDIGLSEGERFVYVQFAGPTGTLSEVLSASIGFGFLDRDGDGVPDDWELENGLDPTDPSDAELDSDGDGLTNAEEAELGLDPHSDDSDGDGLPDGWEIANGLDPKNPADGALDADGDGLTNTQELAAGTDPFLADSDGDGLPDGWETANGLNPTSAADAVLDSDGDGLTNVQEYALGTNPHSADSDGDGLRDDVDPQPANPAPQTTLGSGPAALVGGSAVEIVFGGSDADGVAGFECRLNGGSWTTCTSPHSLSGLADGVYTLEIRAVDAHGHVDPTPVSVTWTVDATSPETVLTSAPSGWIETARVDFVFGGTDAIGIQGFECRLNGGSWTTCTSPLTLEGLADGAYSFAVRAIDAAGNTDPSPAEASWTIDTTLPDTSIGTAPSGTVNVNAATLSFTGTAGTAAFECRLNGAAWEACASPKALSGLGEGPQVFEVRAKDGLDRVDPVPASAAWTIDTVAPDTSIVAGPSGLVVSTSASVQFAGTDANGVVAYECRLDGGDWAVCSSPRALSGLSQGSHTLEVRAIDEVGNVDASPASTSWTVDTVGPETTISAGPSGFVASSSTSLSFSGTDPNGILDYECRLDGGVWTACTSPRTLSGLGDGPRIFAVRAIDSAGNVDGSPASRSWTVDTVPPETSLTSAPSGVLTSSGATLEFNGSDLNGVLGFECRLNGGSWSACSSPRVLSGLAEGAHSFEVRAVDVAGNRDSVPEVATWTTDTRGPTSTFVAAPPALTREVDAVFEVEADEPVTFECRVNGGSWYACGPVISVPDTFALVSEGLNTLEVRATDGVGNIESPAISWEWTLDTIAPTTSWVAVPDALSTEASPTLAFTVDEAATTECRLDLGVWASCTSPWTLPGLADGPRTASVRATDLAGNIEVLALAHDWTVDTQAPETSMDSAPSGVVASTVAAISFSGTDASGILRYECKLDGGAWATCSSPRNLSGLAEGAHTFSVRAVDAAGQTDASPAQASWTVDTIAPDTAIDLGPTGYVASADAAFSFSGSDAGGIAGYECRLDGGAWAACVSPLNLVGLAEGAHTLAARAVDQAGNIDPTPVERAWTIDLTPPETVLDAAPPSTTPAGGLVSVAFSGVDGHLLAGFECNLNGGGWLSCESPYSEGGLPEGNYELEVRAVDGAGNVDPSVLVVEWTISPTEGDWQRISTGQHYTCGIRLDQTLWCWGRNQYGQLGDGTASDRPTPTQVGAFSDWTNVAAGNIHTCGIRNSGRLYCWGYNLYGQVGDGTATNRSAPVQVGTAANWAAVAVGSQHSCGVRTDGRLYCWGYNATGQVGDGTTTNRSTPVQVGTATNWMQVDLGVNFSCGTRADGSMHCWGFNGQGRLGDGTTANRHSPVQIGGTMDWTHVSAGYDHACAVRDDGTLYCWGYNMQGQLGDGTTTDRLAPVQIGGATDWQEVAAQHEHTCGLQEDGTLHCWGRNQYGQLGDGTISNKLAPTLVAVAVEWAGVAGSGGYHTCASDVQGRLYCWGWNNYGEIGDGSAQGSSVPVLVEWRPVGPGDWASVSAGFSHACGIRSSGRLFCWGQNDRGQVGDGSTSDRLSPTSLAMLPDGWVTVSLGARHSCGIREAGDLYCWGGNYSGQVGDGTTTDRPAPTVIAVGAAWRSVAAGGSMSCGVRVDGRLFCWGHNLHGQLGNGTTIESSTPVQVGSAGDWDRVAAGHDFACASKLNGTLYCWGRNNVGQLGIGTSGDRVAPERVSGSGWIGQVVLGTVSAGGHACAPKSDGRVYCWGGNSAGQLGDGTTNDRWSPVQVGAAADWSSASAGSAHSCGIRANGQLYCWGGIGSVYSSSPVRVGRWANWAATTGGLGNACGVLTDGNLFCWGAGNGGKNGHGRTTHAATPEMTVGNDWAQLTAGGNHTCGLRRNGRALCWGANTDRQVGQYGALVPAEVIMATDRRVQQIQAGFAHSCLLRDGQAYCWGAGQLGQIGNGGFSRLTVPTLVAGDHDWQFITGGGDHNCAIRDDRTAWCWGYGEWGQLGNGGSDNESTPVQVGLSADWEEIKAGGNHTCGIRDGGALYCWGYNGWGQVGDGSYTPRSTPSRVGLEADWVSVGVGYGHTCGVRVGGSLWCWGENAYGQLGDNSTIGANVPIPVGVGLMWRSVDGGTYHSCATTVDGVVHCWGRNVDGQLAVGGNVSSLTPARASSGGAWQFLVAGDHHTCAIDSMARMHCRGFNADGQLGDGTTTSNSSALP